MKIQEFDIDRAKAVANMLNIEIRHESSGGISLWEPNPYLENDTGTEKIMELSNWREVRLVMFGMYEGYYIGRDR